MADKLTPEQRHKNMSAIHAKNTKPEVLVRRFLHGHGYRFRLHERRLPGTPDIVMRRLHTVILVNGCFWHGHNLALPEGKELKSEKVKELSVDELLSFENSECCKIPHTNREFWVQKIVRNHERDLHDRDELHRLGWNVITIWECELKPSVRMRTLQSLLYTLSQIELSVLGSKRKVVPYCFEDEPALSRVADESESGNSPQ